MKRNSLLGTVLLSAASLCCAADSTVSGSERLPALRSLAIEIKTTLDNIVYGRSVNATAISNFQSRLTALHADSTVVPDSKVRSVDLLLEELKFQVTNPSMLRVPEHMKQDVEVLTERHGGSCAAALGISTEAPVAIVLAPSGDRLADAWFRFESSNSGRIRIGTDSTGPDPSLEILDGCDRAAARLGSNDDAFGLDSAVLTTASAQRPLFIHMTNSGIRGKVRVHVQTVNMTLSGHVVDKVTNNPLGSSSIYVFGSGGGHSSTSDYTDADGAFSIAVSPGSYYLRAIANQHVSVLWHNAPCAVNTASPLRMAFS